MSGTGSPRVNSLRPGDARQVGAYRLVGRLGEGGMGTVYLAESTDGRTVAVKVIRGELAHDAEFRRRFRGEVARARQVPPFCTAEVLDADTEHDPPYLVVEYVDGPSLAAVISDRGPLSASNQHGLALGVAVALAAIHGAGVIHRDLKPGNVLLAPGSPKVIDFGIARAVEGTDATTRTNQMVGTVAYMAPERFDSSNQPLTPAADIFAWGAIVAYAATGRTPFAAETPAALAYRIMTQPPDLTGVGGALRDLVARALSKDPTQRPTARALIEALLAGGSTVARRPAAFAEQPEVLAAAGLVPGSVADSAAPTAPVPAPRRPPSTMALPTAPPARRPPPSAVVDPAGVTMPRAAPYPAPPRRRGRRVAAAAALLSVLVVAAAVAAAATGLLPLPLPRADGAGGAGGSTTAPATPATTPVSEDSSGWQIPGALPVVKDPLSTEEYWKNSAIEQYDATCQLDGELTVTLGVREAGLYKCQGVRDTLTDFSVAVDVIVRNANSCAGLWFRFTTVKGYVLRICPSRYDVLAHEDTVLTPLQSRTLQPAITLDTPVRVAVKAVGTTLTFYRDGVQVLAVTDATYGEGRVTMGVFATEESQPPYAVTFRNIELWSGPGAG